MPAFQTLVNGKRKSDHSDDFSRKRQSIDVGRSRGVQQENEITEEQYWMVQWRKFQFKKHKTWDGDAVLVVNGAKATLYDLDRKSIGVGKAEPPIYEGKNFEVAGKELEVDRVILRAEYLSGACFGRTTSLALTATIPDSARPSKQFVPLKLNSLPPLGVPHQPPTGPERKGTPLQAVNLIPTVNNSPTKSNFANCKVEDSHWTGNWRKQQNKKHKTWDGDAYISHTENKLTMISDKGKFMGSTGWKGQPLHSGYRFYIGGKEVELDSRVSASLLPTITGAPKDSDSRNSMSSPGLSLTSPHNSHVGMGHLRSIGSPGENSKKFVAPTSFYGTPVNLRPKGPLHDPELEGAVVMKAPTKEHAKIFNKKNLPVVPVVLDPILARHMRPHQKEGVKFLYECVMGLRKHEGQGCILADEMGLGKTLQTISLVWTLLKQNPYAGTGPVLSKVLVVCPVSLVNNWKGEFHKWLGKDRVGVVTCDKEKNVIEMFTNARTLHVLVIGYERLRTVVNQLSNCIPPIGLIICDEGHRLKSANNKTTTMFNALRTSRRIILSGTPIQNDLSEFHTMADFCNPGLLDNYTTFRRVYEVPILKSRAPDCSTKETLVGEARSAQLFAIAKSFVLRRDADLLKNYLPPKHEYVVFVTPTSLQLSIFAKILHPDKLDYVIQGSTAESLALINLLTKISNSPILLKATADKANRISADSDSIKRRGVDDALKLLPEKAQIEDMSLSGKLVALSSLLKIIRQHTEEKCALVSHYTSTLNILEAYCKKQGYSYYRLDGQTPAAKRQEYVNTFNKSPQRSSFIFLLSSKAGGVGINLIGASRLCLIDSDWNPSHDLQSMARIHRDGQKRPVFIYRFLTAGTIDEKIYQRQVTKLGLSDALMGSGSGGSKIDSFTRKDLLDIFRVHPDTLCNTHDLLECPCDGKCSSILSETLATDNALVDNDEDDSESERGFVLATQVKPEGINKMERAYLQKKKAGLAALGEWTHINCLRSTARDAIQDDILRKLLHTRDPDETPSSQPKSRLDSLLSAVDLENVMAMDEVLTVRDVPGGTVSFLFEKSSLTGFEVAADHDGLDILQHT